MKTEQARQILQTVRQVESLGHTSASEGVDSIAMTTAHAAPSPAPTPPGAATLTPAAPVPSSTTPYSPGEDIRDIRQPRHLPPPLRWLAMAAGVFTLAELLFLAWWVGLARRRLQFRLPYAPALDPLEEARQLMGPDHARQYPRRLDIRKLNSNPS